MTPEAAAFDYPLLLNLKQRLVVIVGAGKVGQWKLAGLLQCGAQVRLIDPCPGAAAGLSTAVELLARNFQSGDLTHALLVFACTDQPEVNRAVVAEARRQGIFCASSDNAAQADFALPAVLRRGPLAVTVSTGGGSPALAKHLRDKLDEQLPDCWGVGAEIIAAVRRKWLTQQQPGQYNQQVLRSFWDEKLIPALQQADYPLVDRLLQDTFGTNFSLAQLQIQPPEGMP